MSKKPNIITILADDMGYSDLGCMGGEIETPCLDGLAAGGQLHTQFYNTARCCPTRASFMTGLHPHQAGIGHMTNTPVKGNDYDKGLHGYRGFLNHSSVTIAEALKEGGFHTYMSGKWHLGMKEMEQLPLQRGFEKYYGLLAGACNYFNPSSPNRLYLGNDPIEPEGDFYTTQAFTDYAIRFLEEQEDDNPFFLYLAYNAPHWPLQAPQELVDRYRGRFKKGWDKLREDKYMRMIEKGIIDGNNCPLSKRGEGIRPWEELSDEQKDEMDLRMAIYAAQIHSMDENIGRLLAYLKEQDLLENTLILFLSDNGGCAEGGELGAADKTLLNNPGIDELFVSYGMGWANASNTPFRMYKRYVHEGGMCTPLIASWPKGIKKKGIIHEPSYLIDIMPTFLEIAEASYPDTYHGNKIPPLEGRSLASCFETGEAGKHGKHGLAGELASHEYMFWEHEDHCAIRRGKFKAIKEFESQVWELYDLEKDRSENDDISPQHPEIVKELSQKWEDWADSHHVKPKPQVRERS